MKSEKRYLFSKEFFPVMLEHMEAGNLVSFRITGFSMWPFMTHQRDSVVLTSCDPNTLKKGDIVLFQRDGDMYAVHRITKINNGTMETTGDGNLFRDGVFPLDWVKAKAVSINRKGKTIHCEDLRWKIVFRVWMALFPVRGPLLKALRFWSRL